jgi:hypothetical protein
MASPSASLNSLLRPSVLLILIAATLGFYAWFSDGWRGKPKIPTPPANQKGLLPSGGDWFFTRIEIPVPLYRQGDSRWASDPLAWGAGGDTIGTHGCAVTSVAMVVNSYGIFTTPREVNNFLVKNKGFTAEGWLMWEKVTTLAPDRLRFKYEGEPKYSLIDSNLRQRNPVIVRLRFPPGEDGQPGPTHFVVIVGKEGHDYLVRDPGRAGSRGTYPLKEFGSKIEALRFYEKIVPVTQDRQKMSGRL